MWGEIESTFYEMASDKYNEDLPELRLFCAMIVEAGKEDDIEYFYSDEFETHSRLLRLSSAFIFRIIKKAWNVVKDGKEWQLTIPLEEDD